MNRLPSCLLLLTALLALSACKTSMTQKAAQNGQPSQIISEGNLVRNADLAEGLTEWTPLKLAEQTFKGDKFDGVAAIHVTTLGEEATLMHKLDLKPGSFYRLSFEAKGESVLRFRLPGSGVEPVALATFPSKDFRKYDWGFLTNDAPDGNLLMETWFFTLPGETYVKNLSVKQEPYYPARGQAIPVEPEQAITAEKLLVEDCRVVRGKDFAPVDDTTDSRGWNSRFYEYATPYSVFPANISSGPVLYDYLENNGVHIKLADDKGVDAVVIRGGAACNMYSDLSSYDQPDPAKLVHTFAGQTRNSRAYFPERVKGQTFSFFDVCDGYLGNVSFFRISRQNVQLPTIGSARTSQATELVKKYMLLRFPQSAGTFDTLISSRIKVSAGQTVHFAFTSQFNEPISQIRFNLTVRSKGSITPVTLALQDPANPRLEYAGADFDLHGNGSYQINLAFPNLLLFEGDAIWVTATIGAEAEISGSLSVLSASEDKARAESLAYYKMLLEAQFLPQIETGQWNKMRPEITDTIAWAESLPSRPDGRNYGVPMVDLLRTLNRCRALDPKDQTVDVIYREVNNIHDPAARTLPEPTIARTPGAPEWADVLHQGYLALRAVPEYWLKNRLTPDGEMGGRVNDDTDFYQFMADFSMFEDGGVGGGILEATKKLAAHAREVTYLHDFGPDQLTIPGNNSDPMHYYEDGMSTHAQLTWQDYGDPIAFERNMDAALATEKYFTVTVRDGERFWHGLPELGRHDLIQRPEKPGVADEWYMQQLHPTWMTVWYNNNPRAAGLLKQMTDTWLKYCAPGQYATAIDVATGEVKALRTNLRPTLSPIFLMTAELLKDPKCREVCQYVAENVRGWGRSDLVKAINFGVVEVNDKVRERAQTDGGFADWFVNGNLESLLANVKRTIAQMQTMGMFYTQIEPNADRPFLWEYSHPVSMAYLGGAYQRIYIANSHAVSWSGFGTDYAALCLHSRHDGLKFALYSFVEKPMVGTMKVWMLDHGNYKVRQGVDANGDFMMDEQTSEANLELYRSQGIQVRLESGKVTIVEVTQTDKLPDIRDRADLAISPLEVVWRDGGIEGIVHNIGSADAAYVSVCLVNPFGEVVQIKELGKLEAPLDLKPKQVKFRFDGVPSGKGWKVVVDPVNDVPEIYEGNNSVTIH